MDDIKVKPLGNHQLMVIS